HCRLNNTSPSIRFLLHAYIYSAIKDLQSKAPDKNIVIFTHNHCLTYIAKDKRDATFKPDYLDGLVMHVEKGKVYLDGEFVNH
ncbi:MAG: hypothetical protein J7E05_07195, partial [Escherichia coli]|nr:hypothetical protein [Escherichia coli]